MNKSNIKQSERSPFLIRQAGLLYKTLRHFTAPFLVVAEDILLPKKNFGGGGIFQNLKKEIFQRINKYKEEKELEKRNTEAMNKITEDIMQKYKMPILILGKETAHTEEEAKEITKKMGCYLLSLLGKTKDKKMVDSIQKKPQTYTHNFVPVFDGKRVPNWKMESPDEFFGRGKG